MLNSSKQTRIGQTSVRGHCYYRRAGDNPLRTLRARLARVFVAIAIILPANFVHADTVDEAALRMSLSLAQSQECTSASSTLSVVAMPAIDTSRSLTDEQLDLIRSEYLIAIGSELPSCARLTDAVAAFGTIEFMTEVDSSGRITQAQQDLIESKLQNAHSVLVLKIEKLDERYQATAQLTSISEGQTISVTRIRCARTSNADRVWRKRCLLKSVVWLRLADDMLGVLNPIKGLHVKNGLYQDTDETSGYGSYIAQQFLVALTNERKKRVFKSEFPIKLHRENSVVDEGEYELTLRYWVCDDNKSANLTVTAEARDGNSGVFTQSLSLQLLPSGISYAPKIPSQRDQFPTARVQTTTTSKNLKKVTGVASSDVLWLRSCGSTKCDRVGSLSPGESNVYTTDCSQGWCKVYDSSGSYLGWASSRYLSSTTHASQSITYRVTGVASNDVLWVRSCGSTSCERRGSLAPNEVGIEIPRCDGNWCEVLSSQSGVSGWASRRYLARE